MRNRIRLLVIALLAVLSLAACGNEGSGTATGKADEIAVIAVKDSADVTKAADSLRAHVESRRKLFLQYGPAEAARVEKAQVFTKDQYAVLIICDDSPTVKTAFDDFLPSSDTGSD